MTTWVTRGALLFLVVGNFARAATSYPAYAQEVVRATNAIRQQYGLAPLRVSNALSRAALGHAADQADRGYFDHNTPEGLTPSDRMVQAGYPYGGGENIYMAQGVNYGVPSSAMSSWMNSAGHRENILSSSYREIGVGVAASKSGAIYYVQNFGSYDTDD